MKALNATTCFLLLFSLTIGCSTFVADEEPMVVSYGDPSMDAPVMVPQDEGSDQGDDTTGIVDQKNQIMLDRYLDNAKNLKEKLKYEEAQDELIKALSIDPANSKAIGMLNQIQSLLGNKSGEISEIKKMAADRSEVRKQQLKHKALDDYYKGQLYKDRGEYDKAMLFFESVINQIGWSANSVDWESLEEDAKTALEETKRLKVDAETKLRQQQEKEAFEKIRQEEVAQKAALDYQISVLLEAAIDEVMKMKFDLAQEHAEEVLKLDPKHEKAMELIDNIEEARREVNARIYVEKKREAYQQWKEDIEETRIPYYGILNELDEEEWNKISQKRSTAKVLGLESVDSPENRALSIRLKNTRSDFNFEDDEITTVANVINAFTGIPVVVNGEVKMELEDNAQTITLTDLKGISVESLLNIITDQIGEGLTWTIDKGVVVITKQEKLVDNILPRLHPIKDITFGVTEFRGPVIGQITPPDETGEGPEDSIFGGDLETEQPIPPEEVINLIQENIARESWDMDQFSVDITADQGSVLVIHTPEVQKQIADFLDDLRRFASSCVTIESRFISINDSFLQEIGADWRGLGNDGKASSPIMDVTNGFEDNASEGMDNQGDGGEGANPSAGIFFNDNTDGDIRFRNEGVFNTPLGDMLSTIGGGAFQFSLIDDTMFNLVVRAVEKSYNATEITAPVITAYNTQRSYITVINQVSFIQGFDVDVATSAFIANPNVGIIQEGIVLDVKPTVSYDRKYITLELQTTVAELERPIRTRSTPLAGQTTPVTFQLPNLVVSTAATTVVVPDGGSLILGGMKRIRYISREAEAPILSKIPILGFFFRERGLDDEVESLIILARASIQDMNDIRERTKLSH